MNDIKVLQCCDNCKWGESYYEGEVLCKCPTALAKAKKIDEYNDTLDDWSKDWKEVDWIYDCKGKVLKDRLVSDAHISTWGSHQCMYWEELDEEERKKEKLRDTIRMVLENGGDLK